MIYSFYWYLYKSWQCCQSLKFEQNRLVYFTEPSLSQKIITKDKFVTFFWPSISFSPRRNCWTSLNNWPGWISEPRKFFTWDECWHTKFFTWDKSWPNLNLSPGINFVPVHIFHLVWILAQSNFFTQDEILTQYRFLTKNEILTLSVFIFYWGRIFVWIKSN